MTEIVTHGTDELVVPREDANALAAAIRDLIRDPDTLARLSKAARGRVAVDLNQQAVAAKVAETLREAERNRRYGR